MGVLMGSYKNGTAVLNSKNVGISSYSNDVTGHANVRLIPDNLKPSKKMPKIIKK